MYMKKVQYQFKLVTLGAMEQVIKTLRTADIVVSIVTQSPLGAIIEMSLPNDEDFTPDEILMMGVLIGQTETMYVLKK